MDNFRFKKKFGQNFLNDQGILSKIANSVSIDKDDLIIEIGPGQGALTKYLVEKGCKVIAFEIDLEVKEYLDKIDSSNLEVVYGDILDVDFNKYNLNQYNKIHVIANLPYYITTPIIEKIVNSNIGETDLVLMVQKEVADRFSATPCDKSYGSMTVFLNFFYEVNKLFDVNRKCFYPVPNVDSAVIKLVRKDNFDNNLNNKDFWNFIKECFQFKRKNIKNNLKKYNASVIDKVLESFGHDLNSRAEEFTLEEFIELYNELKKHIN